MNFSRFFIDRPIFAGVVSTLIFLGGLIAMFQLPIAEYPEVSPPSIVVTAQFPGGNPTEIAETVATPLEEQINGVEGMLYMNSLATTDGNLSLTVTFEIGTDPDLQLPNGQHQLVPIGRRSQCNSRRAQREDRRHRPAPPDRHTIARRSHHIRPAQNALLGRGIGQAHQPLEGPDRGPGRVGRPAGQAAGVGAVDVVGQHRAGRAPEPRVGRREQVQRHGEPEAPDVQRRRPFDQRAGPIGPEAEPGRDPPPLQEPAAARVDQAGLVAIGPLAEDPGLPDPIGPGLPPIDLLGGTRPGAHVYRIHVRRRRGRRWRR